MKVQEYIDSGVLYDYCTGTLSASQKAEVEKICVQYPAVQQELVELRETFGDFGTGAIVKPKPALQETIWGALDNVNKEKSGDLSRLPVVNKYSDHNNWKRLVLPFMPEDLKHDRIIKTIRESGGVTQMLVITKTDVEEEIHEHEEESFIVLEGECECYIGGETYRLGPGGFIEIPMYAKHNVRVLSPYVVAVLQHVAV